MGLENIDDLAVRDADFLQRELLEIAFDDHARDVDPASAEFFPSGDRALFGCESGAVLDGLGEGLVAEVVDDGVGSGFEEAAGDGVGERATEIRPLLTIDGDFSLQDDD